MIRRSTRSLAARAVAGLALAAAVTLGIALGTAGPASAADLSKFDPGFIISDAVFANSTSMSQAQVADFIQQKGASCVAAAGSTCLKDYVETTASRAATNRCATYNGAANETAAQIVAKVAVACGINPQVLLVTLQKEQGLVTATGGKPATTYQKAMGYGCPDTAACNTLYYGFFNQVYSAASQFRNYDLNPGNYGHRAGIVNNILYNPNAACGSSPVLIKNQATADLYNYTPYQPNAAALAAGYGTGDSCSSYGNRNFFAYFSDWFGSPTGNPPYGFLDSVTVSGLQVTATGWAIDPETNAPITVHMYVGSASQAFTADVSRPDVGAALGHGDNHGYAATMTAPAGTNDVCVWAINTDAVSGNTLLGCRTVTVPSPLVGRVDAVTPDPTGVTVSGWVYDPDSTSTATTVRVTLDGAATTTTANTPRPDVDGAYHAGPNHGFSLRLPAALGAHQVCATALKAAPGIDKDLGCSSVTVVNHTPIGRLESVTATATAITAKGWAIDPDTASPITVHMYVDGASQAFTADGSRPELASTYGLGANHGFTTTMSAAPGAHTVCLYAINTTAGDNPQLGCAQVTVTNHVPVGFVDAFTAGPDSVTVSGWALDPDTTSPIAVHLYVDGASRAFVADGSRPDVDAVFHDGPNHGYTATMPAAQGTHTVCLYAIDSSGGPSPQLACRTLTVRNQTPIGFIDSITATSGKVTAQGWALDPDTSDPITVHLYVDGASQAFTADGDRPDVDAVFHLGARHGFTATMNANAGSHQVCVYAINTTAGVNPLLVCRTVVVPS